MLLVFLSQLAAFSDLDTDPADLAASWSAAKAALVLMMRSWPGILQITSGDMGLTALVKMLRDQRIPVATQDVILDALTEVLAPVFPSAHAASTASKHQHIWSTMQEQLRASENASIKSPSAGQFG